MAIVNELISFRESLSNLKTCHGHTPHKINDYSRLPTEIYGFYAPSAISTRPARNTSPSMKHLNDQK